MPLLLFATIAVTARATLRYALISAPRHAIMLLLMIIADIWRERDAAIRCCQRAMPALASMRMLER